MSNPRPIKVPTVDLRAQYSQLPSEIREAIDEVLETQQFILGPAVKRFEGEMAAYLGGGFAVGVASGTDALLLALMALDIGPGDGVIVPPFTFFSTVSSITRLGATPLFVDSDPESYLLSPVGAAAYVEERCRRDGGQLTESKSRLRVRAVLPVHLFGQCCAMTAFLTLAKKYQLSVIEDVAQACGARTTISGISRFAGTIGDLGCFSFFPSKNLGGYGDGGLITTDDATTAKKSKNAARPR